MVGQVKRAFKYRFYPTGEQAAELSRTFGCVRLVYDRALEERTSAWYREQRRVSYVESSALLTEWKKTPELAFLSEVSSVPSQQALRHLQAAFAGFFDDFLHEFSTRLIRESQTVVIEDLNVRNMVADHSLARAISDAAWRELRTMLECKADWYGRELVVIDRWFPSSKLCSNCGTITQKMPLNVREWACGCGAVHDRDVNAARNIMAAGLAVTACGAGVRPQRESSRTGRSAVKQETHGAARGTPSL